MTKARVTPWRHVEGLWSRGPVPPGVLAVVAVFLWFVAIDDPQWWRIAVASSWSMLSIAQFVGNAVRHHQMKQPDQLPDDATGLSDRID